MQKEAILQRILFNLSTFHCNSTKNIFVSVSSSDACVLVIYCSLFYLFLYFPLSLHRELNERKIDKPVSCKHFDYF